ncbi:hypothetical protein Tco_0988734 [Tanacetum coccineum]|uniref:Xylulose kinase-1 n=1 Tax=Tanacetum coccineum TaxID=301880 RepID=A0ABQ5ERS3_9ASTR
MVAYLQKPEGSEAFHQIVDFLNASHIKYALIENPKIYISLIQQFWGTATTRTTDDGEFPTQTQVADEVAFTSVDVDARGAATTDIGLEAGQDSGTMHKTPTRPHDSPLLRTKKVYSFALTKLIMRVNKLEHRVKIRQPKRMARVIISDTKEDLEDPSKKGRRIAEIDQNPSISLVQDEGTSWIQEDAEIQGKTSVDIEILLDQEEPTKLVEDLGSGEKGEKEIITANISISTASATPEVSIAAANLVYIRRSAEKRKDKGKAIMKEDESVQKKAKKKLEQERLGHEEAIRLHEQINEEEKQRIARDAEIAKQLQEEFDKARQEQEVIAEADQAHDIDWSDHAMLRYHALQNRSFFIAEVRKNMCIAWDQNNDFVPKDSKIEKEVIKRTGFDFLQKSIKKNDKIKALGFVQKQPAEEEKENKNDDSQQQAGCSKKRSREDSDEDNDKKQKLEDDAKKEELRDSMDVVPRDDIAIDVESLDTKYPIVDWKTYVLTENMMYYQIIRADGSSTKYSVKCLMILIGKI